MTLPDERYRSLVHTKRFLMELCDPTKTPRVPKEVRRRASGCLRHWPDDYHLELICTELPSHFARQMEPLHRMILKHQQDNRSLEWNPEVVQPRGDSDK